MPFSYGRVSEGFQSVMKNEKAIDFVGAFERRREIAVMSNAKGFALMALPGLRSIGKADLNRREISLPEAPAQCRYCYKLYGI